LHWANEFTIVGRYVYCDITEWVIVNVNPVEAELIGVDERLVQQLTHPNCFVEN
jgi:hypothetical protein